jgi:hypothetical protein
MSKNTKIQQSRATIYVVCGTKGGGGKTTVASQALPTVYLDPNTQINVFELDNNNRTDFSQSKSIHFQTFNMNESEDAIESVSFDFDTQASSINIVDCGGSDDTKTIIPMLANSGLKGLIYFIPVNKDYEQFNNAQDTIELIKKHDPNPIIYVVFNRVSVLDESEIKKQFIGFFGKKETGIPAQIGKIEKDVKGFLFIKEDELFDQLKSYYKRTLRDMYFEAKEILDNEVEYRQAWAKEGPEIYKQKKEYLKLARQVMRVIVDLDSFQSALQGEING